jgi:hypothetical protein
MMRARTFATAVLAVALLAVAGLAVASIPGSDGVISGCYKNSTGQLSVIDSGATCPNGTTLLQWNHTGPQGPPGVAGLRVQQVVTELPSCQPSPFRTPLEFTAPPGEVILSANGFNQSFFVETGQPASPDFVSIPLLTEQELGRVLHMVPVDPNCPHVFNRVTMFYTLAAAD